MKLIILQGTYSIYRFKPSADITDLIHSPDFYSLTRTNDELSVVALQMPVKLKGVISNKGWRVIKIEGPLKLTLIGIIADITNLLKEKKIPVFVISTFETDYILIKKRKLNEAIFSLKEQGYIIFCE